MGAQAQNLQRLPNPHEQVFGANPAQTTQIVRPKPQQIHVSDALMQLPDRQATLISFKQLMAAGQLPLSKTAIDPKVGDSLEFRLYNFNDRKFYNSKFYLRFTNEKLNVWAEAAEVKNKHILDTHIQALQKALLTTTPASPSQGIVVANIETFGEPPNSDGDGRLDVLVHDIKDEYDGEQVFSYIGGYVDASDLPGVGGNGNKRDILHLDSYPGLETSNSISIILGTAAHEHQHLIHYNYDLSEDTFINEGLSEWAEILNGYTPRYVDYWTTFTDSDGNKYDADYNVSLLSWRRSDSDKVLNDYQRAGLITTYLAEQLGTSVTGSITRDPATGINGYTNALKKGPNPISIATMMSNWHTANYVNDSSLNAAWGYTSSHRQKISPRMAPLTLNREIDGLASTTASNVSERLNPGGVNYIRWKNVKDFQIQLDVIPDVGGTPAEYRSTVQARLYLVNTSDGKKQVKDLTLGSDTETITGEFKEATLILAHVNPNPQTALIPQIRYNTKWSSNISTKAIEIKYGDNSEVAALGSGYTIFSLSAKEKGGQASVFVKPTNAVSLQKVAVAPYYLNQFSNTGLGTDVERDLKLTVWKSNGKGRPGDEIFSLDVTDPRAYDVARIGFQFFDIDLAPHVAKLSALPDSVFIGWVETGTDANYMVVAASEYTGSNTSFIRGVSQAGAIGWATLNGVQLTGGATIANATLAIRPTFLVKNIVPIESEATLPDQISLAQNFPNPFNPSTQIQYSLPAAGRVRLTVYDVLGRMVTRLVDTDQGAGQYSVLVNASTWASGVYFYTLESGQQRMTQKMLLLK